MTNILFFPRYLLRLYLMKTELERLMLALVFFSSAMLFIRIAYTGEITFIFLEWNLFLAFIPYFITKWLGAKPFLLKNKGLFGLIFLAWLLVIPNSFYILTDLFHLPENGNAPMWFDLLLLFSFAWIGMLAGILSLWKMEKLVQVLCGLKHELMFLFPVMLLNALGIFIGRYLRYNSWDVVTNPFHLMMDILDLMIHPVLYRNSWGMIIFYAVFMTLFYMTVKRISKFVN